MITRKKKKEYVIVFVIGLVWYIFVNSVEILDPVSIDFEVLGHCVTNELTVLPCMY